MKLGVYLHLGPLYGGDWNATLTKAKTLREAGVRHVFAANAPVDTVAIAKGDDAAWLNPWKAQVNQRLKFLDEIGLTVGVRPMPLCTEQVVVPIQYVLATGAQPTTVGQQPTPDFTIHRTSIDAARSLTLGDHYLYACHEAHDILDGKQRRWLIEQLGPRTIIYYGHRGLWNKYGADFGEHDLMHVVHVALNAAGANDSSAAGGGVVPRDCTAKQMGEFIELINDSVGNIGIGHAHINVTASATVARLVAMAYEVHGSFLLSGNDDVLMFRNVDDKGQTIHEVPANVLEAIKELEGVA